MPRVTRREMLRLGSGLGIGLVAAACSNDSPTSASRTERTTSTQGSSGTDRSSGTRTGATPDCVLTPEAIEGPFYLDVDAVRRDITEGRGGAPLAIELTVVDASRCAPIEDAGVDVWQCDATGVYSGFAQGGSEPGQTFLRGTQISDADGIVRFDAIYPGWYEGRAVHTHVKVHVGGEVVHTGQLFYDDDLTDDVFRRAPYDERGTRDVRNDADAFFEEAGGDSAILPVRASGDGYAGSITVGVQTS